jgi:hypothetical protein
MSSVVYDQLVTGGDNASSKCYAPPYKFASGRASPFGRKIHRSPASDLPTPSPSEFHMSKSSGRFTQSDSTALTPSHQITLAYSTRNRFRCVERAITKFDSGGLLQRVHAAEQALFNRWTGMTDSVDDKKERQAMEAAARKLRDIRIYVLGWPGL